MFWNPLYLAGVVLVQNTTKHRELTAKSYKSTRNKILQRNIKLLNFQVQDHTNMLQNIHKVVDSADCAKNT